ncbi:MAG: hypothetical protein J5I90_18135 [Caldilineales bacterium]|nr:hypothetical protein [Caldilineales bacterium]
MTIEHPDLSLASPAIIAYIETLEDEIERLTKSRVRATAESFPAEPSEPPTTINVISISAEGMAKRTPRHHYTRQRRGGMGVFDLESPDDDKPAFLATADESAALLVISNRGRAFRLPVAALDEAPIRARGQSLLAVLNLAADERLACVLPADAGAYLVITGERGQVRRFAAHLVGERMRPGTTLLDLRESGQPAAACWSDGHSDLFIASRSGLAIRFSEQQAPVRGCLGIRLQPDDPVVAVASVTKESAVFMLGSDGRGTVRQMSGFRANKAPGAGGKTAIKVDELVGAAVVRDEDDIFIISELGKIIRFPAAEIPAKEGVVQGVNCMDLRADRTSALTITR